jgi:sulfite reductase alpha subunit-like flavoprotein
MSKTHSYRIQVHCSKVLHARFMQFAGNTGLGESAAARELLSRGLERSSDDVSIKLERIGRRLESILNAAVAARLFAAESMSKQMTQEESTKFRERMATIISRYVENEAAGDSL